MSMHFLVYPVPPHLLPKNGEITDKLAEDLQSGFTPQPGSKFVLTAASLIKLFLYKLCFRRLSEATQLHVFGSI